MDRLPSDPGRNLRVRTDATFEWSNAVSYTLTGGASATCTSVTESTNLAPPQGRTVTVRVSAQASGCATPVYQFWLQGPGLAWTIVQAHTTTPTWDWNTSSYPPGVYQIAVWSKQQGSAATQEWTN